MSKPTITRYQPHKTVIGDNTSAKSRILNRLRRWRMLGIVILVALLTALLLAVLRPGGSKVTLHPDNAEHNGAMAVTQILQQQGVSVHETGAIGDAVANADANTTVFVYDSYFIAPESYKEILDRGANLVITKPSFDTTHELNLGLTTGSHDWDQDPHELVPAQCEAPSAVNANEVPAGATGFTLDDGYQTELCFTVDGLGAYAASEDGRVHLFAEDLPFMNSNLTIGGNAALTLGALGAKENLIWVIPSMSENDLGDPEAPTMLDFLPPWFDAVFLLAVFTALFLALWRGRRMGPLVTEPLPVEVRGAEATVGLGRMYRRGDEVAHAASALRAGTALRCAQRLGIAPTASGEAIASAIAHATNRTYEDIAGLLLGAAVQNENDLIALAQMLDHLESEVHAS